MSAVAVSIAENASKDNPTNTPNPSEIAMEEDRQREGGRVDYYSKSSFPRPEIK